MNRIVVLIDFTEGCKVAIEQAKVIAKYANAKIVALHFVTKNDNLNEVEKDLSLFTSNTMGEETNFETIISAGELMHNAAAELVRIDPMLVVVGTHGVKGIKQNLFGAHILKLVQSIPFPCLVVQENTKVNTLGIKKILFPVGPHKSYAIKTAQTAMMAGIFDADIVQYEIERPLIAPDPELLKNMKDAKEFFQTSNNRFSEVKEDSKVISVGYARQTINYAEENKFDIISLMSDVPMEDAYIGRTDKENFLTNAAGIPVLCCNK